MVDPEIHYVTATKNHGAELIEFWRGNAENNARPVDDLNLVIQLINRDPDAILIATKNSKIVGSVIAGWDGWRGSIYRLAVDESLRRGGIASQLMHLAEERLKELGATRVSAMVLVENDVAQPFYKRNEFVMQEHWRRWVKSL